MTTSQARGLKEDALTDTKVADFLRTYPDFFERNAALLAQLRLPHVRDSTATVSLVERQVEVLRERNQALERKLKELVDVARANDELADRIHRLSQRLIRARDLASTVEAIETSLREDFEAMHSVLVLFLDEARALEPRTARFLRVDRADGAEVKSFESLLSIRQAALRPDPRFAAGLSVRQGHGRDRLGRADALGPEGEPRNARDRRERCATGSTRR